MEYPTTSILDSFTRGDEDPVANFSSAFGGAGDVFRLVSNAINADSLLNGIATGYWDAGTFGPDMEAWVTVATKGANGEYASVFARMLNPGFPTTDLYDVRATTDAGTDIWTINRVDNAVGTPLGSTFTQEVSNGDGIGIRCIKDRISAWYRSGGVWTKLAERTDGTYSAAGYAGVGVNNTTVYFDDFGGGTFIRNFNTDSNRLGMFNGMGFRMHHRF